MRRWKIALVALAVLAGPALAAGCAQSARELTVPATLAAHADAAPTPQLDWTDCADERLAGYRCAVATVPLDYSRLDGPTIEIAVVKQSATEPDRRVGTLFAAAGGPGDSGLDWARRGPMFAGEISRRFDIVTFDQRGVGASTPVRCFADAAEQERFWETLVLPPLTEEQQRAAAEASRAYAEGCARHSGELLPHLTTVDAARDLDLLRRAVGEDQLTFTGGSYASYLGQVYGVLFGDRVRALHLSSLIDPRAYSVDTRTQVASTAAGTHEVFEEFLRLCAQAGRDGCAFVAGGERGDLTGNPAPSGAQNPGSEQSGTVQPSPDQPATGQPGGDVPGGDVPGGASPSTEKAGGSGGARVTTTLETPVPDEEIDRLRERDAALFDRLREGPIVVGAGERAVAVDYAQAVRAHALLLYDAEQGWPALAGLLAELERGQAGDPEIARQALAVDVTDPDFLDSFLAITCADTALPRDPDRWPELAAQTPQNSPPFDDFWLYARQPCGAWTTAEDDPRRGVTPWTLISEKPALLVSNEFDPVTPLAFAERAQQELVNARLVVVEEGYGHRPAGDCVRNLRERYLIDLRLPAPGATCSTQQLPFSN
ncbi:alpha/beta hydrolase [Nocardia shimofusensis]|uniref:alpha/beta hydrolase n=1 Tax=Nocardia shimofusensis TaxID=228596 RepID=UPI000A944DE5|nr:alpha/beta hydrolase [Nocardia shimofusensis]